MELLNLFAEIPGFEVERMAECGTGLLVANVFRARFGCVSECFIIAKSRHYEKNRDDADGGSHVFRVSLLGLSAN